MKKFTFLKTSLLAMALMASVGAVKATDDVLVATDLAATSTSYTDFSGVEGTSGAVYAGNNCKSSTGAIQIRSNNSNSGIASTTSGGYIRTVTVVWDEATVEGRTLNVYGSNNAYTAATDLYDAATQGTLLGTIVMGTSTTITVEGNYRYVGIRSNSGAMYLTNVTFGWEAAAPAAVATPAFSVPAGNYDAAQNVAITCETAGTTIYYTTNGETPTAASSVYSAPIAISTTTTLKAIACTATDTSAVATATYVFPTENTIAEILAMEADILCKTTGVVAAVYERGFILKDNTGAILVYVGSSYDKAQAIGDNVTVTATTDVYNKGPQLVTPEITTNSTGNAVDHGTATAINSANIASMLALEKVETPYVEMTGTLSISGTYYNITMDGVDAATAQGSISYPTDDLSSYADQAITVKGYFYSISSSKYIYMVMTEISTASALTQTQVLADVTFDGTIISNPNAKEISVYNATGARVAEAAANIDMTNMPNGMYIVRSGKTAMKIVK